MRDWLREMASSLLHLALVLFVFFGVSVGLALALTVAGGVSAALAGSSASIAARGASVGFLGAMLAGVVAARMADRRFPARSLGVVRETCRALDLRTVLDVRHSTIAKGTLAGRDVRLQFMGTWLGRKVTVAISTDAKGYGYFGPRSEEGRQGMDLAWLQSIEDDPVGRRALRMLTEGVNVMPRQIVARGRDRWLESPEILKERVLALLDLAEVVERLPATSSEGTRALRRVNSWLPDPGAPTPILDLSRKALTVVDVGVVALTLVLVAGGGLSALIFPWLAS